MSVRYLATVTALAATVALAFGASSASSETRAQARFAAPALASTTQQVGTVTVRFAIKRFVKRRHQLIAIGTAIAQFKPTDANSTNLPTKTIREAFAARVIGLRQLASANTICPVLDLTLGPLDLSLLGLIVHLDKVHLTITADSQGGVLGSLFCSLANGKAKLAQYAKRLT